MELTILDDVRIKIAEKFPDIARPLSRTKVKFDPLRLDCGGLALYIGKRASRTAKKARAEIEHLELCLIAIHAKCDVLWALIKTEVPDAKLTHDSTHRHRSRSHGDGWITGAGEKVQTPASRRRMPNCSDNKAYKLRREVCVDAKRRYAPDCTTLF
jgi:hypothetical protein